MDIALAFGVGLLLAVKAAGIIVNHRGARMK